MQAGAVKVTLNGFHALEVNEPLNATQEFAAS